MLVLLYLEKIFIFTTSALLNPAAYFLGKTVWFTLTAVSITTPNFCYLHLVFWTGHIPSIKSLWWFNRETANIIYLGLKTSVVKKIQREPNAATQFLSWPTELLFGNILGTYQNSAHCAGLSLPTAAASIHCYCSAKCPVVSAQDLWGIVSIFGNKFCCLLFGRGSMEIAQRAAGPGPRNWGHDEGNAKVINYTNVWVFTTQIRWSNSLPVFSELCSQLQTETS